MPGTALPLTAEMRTIRRTLARAVAGLALLAALVFAAPVHADDRMTVVELFTSQGCPACPSADKLLGELSERPDILALEFHVDYWDYIGWRDPFANPLYAQRQQRYLDKLNLPYVYTPQIVVDGQRHASGNKPASIDENIARAQAETQGRVPVTLERISEDQVRIRIVTDEQRYRGEAEILIVRFDARHVTEVTRGENKGKTLVNRNVVRLMRPVAVWNGEPMDVVVSLQALGHTDPEFCAIIVQERGQGRILGASMVDMRAAAPRG